MIVLSYLPYEQVCRLSRHLFETYRPYIMKPSVNPATPYHNIMLNIVKRDYEYLFRTLITQHWSFYLRKKFYQHKLNAFAYLKQLCFKYDAYECLNVLEYIININNLYSKIKVNIQ